MDPAGPLADDAHSTPSTVVVLNHSEMLWYCAAVTRFGGSVTYDDDPVKYAALAAEPASGPASWPSVTAL